MFAKHDVIKAPPFAHLYLISCRNMLIYFNQTLQNRVISTFHYALNPNGYLFIGKSESITQFSDLFSPVSKRWKIFEAKPIFKGDALAFRHRAMPAGGVGYQKTAATPPPFRQRDDPASHPQDLCASEHPGGRPYAGRLFSRRHQSLPQTPGGRSESGHSPYGQKRSASGFEDLGASLFQGRHPRNYARSWCG